MLKYYQQAFYKILKILYGKDGGSKDIYLYSYVYSYTYI